MNRRTSLLAAVLAGGFLTTLAGQTSPPASEVPASPRISAPKGSIEAIRIATDPSSAVNAYADAKSADPNNIEVPQTYLEKMISLQLPELAETQAKEIVDRDPRYPQAWAVLAYMHGKRGQTTQALTEITIAAQNGNNDPFVMRTAGSLIAWYDAKADKNAVPDSVRQSLEKVRQTMRARSDFADAYAKSTEAYRNADAAGAAPGTAPNGAAPSAQSSPSAGGYVPDAQVPVNPDEQAMVPAPQPYIVPDTNYYASQPYAYDGYPAYYPSAYYEPWYPSCYEPYGYGGFLIVGNFGSFGDRDRFFNRDRFFDRDFDRSFGRGVIVPPVDRHRDSGFTRRPQRPVAAPTAITIRRSEAPSASSIRASESNVVFPAPSRAVQPSRSEPQQAPMPTHEFSPREAPIRQAPAQEMPSHEAPSHEAGASHESPRSSPSSAGPSRR